MGEIFAEDIPNIRLLIENTQRTWKIHLRKKRLDLKMSKAGLGKQMA